MRGRRDPGQPESGVVDPDCVSTLVVQHDRPVGNCAIQALSGQSGLVHQRRAPGPGGHERRRRVFFQEGRDHVETLVCGARAAQRGLEQLRERAGTRMHVRVCEAGEHCPAFEVHDARVGVGPRERCGGRPDQHDAPALHDDRFRDGSLCINGVDDSVDQCEIRHGHAAHDEVSRGVRVKLRDFFRSQALRARRATFGAA